MDAQGFLVYQSPCCLEQRTLQRAMKMQVQGILVGRYIELLHALDLPDGQHVMVDVHPTTLSLEEKRRLVDEACGAWAGDSSLAAIFKGIDHERHDCGTRRVNLDASCSRQHKVLQTY